MPTPSKRIKPASPTGPLAKLIAERNDMLVEAGKLAEHAANRRLPWGVRYRNAVISDECFEIAKRYDEIIRGLLAKGQGA